jgi:hypothetical protein
VARSLKTQQRAFTSRPDRLGFGLPRGNRNNLVVPAWARPLSTSSKVSFKLEVTELAGLPANQFFTESLILAQDERWRRA